MTRRVSHANNKQQPPRGHRRCLGVSCVVIIIIVLGPVLFSTTDQSGVLTPQDYKWLRENSRKYTGVVDPVDPFQLAAQQSYGYLKDISDESWRRFLRRSLKAPQYRFPDFPERAFGVPIRWFIKNLQPVLTCPTAERIGGLVDRGAFWMCEPERLNDIRGDDVAQNAPSCLVYSIGYSGAFEVDLVQRLPFCEVHVMDPQPAQLPLVHPRIHLHMWGLRSTATNAATNSSYLSLSETRHRLGHMNRHVDVLKLDCDRCAWSSFREWIALNATQILWQAVGLPSPKEANTYHPGGPLHFASVFTMLQQHGYAMFAKDHRQNGPRMALGYLRLHPDFWTQAERLAKEDVH